MNNSTIPSLLLVSVFLGPVARAGDPAPPLTLNPPAGEQAWTFELAIYGFLAGLDGTVSVGDQSVSTSFDFQDILDNLDATFMGSASATRGRFCLAGDFLYLGVSGDATPKGIVYDLAKLELDSVVTTVNGTYRVWERDGSFLELGVGVRYLGMDTTLKLRDSDDILPSQEEDLDMDLWDGLGVIRFHHEFSPKWFVRCYGDIGTGDSDLTWQVFATLGYAMNDRAAILLGWRHLEYDQESGAAEVDIFFSGPQIGAGFKF